MAEGHTPGPWRYESGSDTIRSVPANYWIASIDSWEGAVDHAANARLIAAAPTMLEALKDLVRCVERDNLHTTRGVDLRKAKASIALARGGT